MQHAKPKSTPAPTTDMISEKDGPIDEAEREKMRNIDYRGLVGSLMYLMTGSRPDIAFAISRGSMFLHNPGQKHWEFAKQILRYVASTIDYGQEYDGTLHNASQLVC